MPGSPSSTAGRRRSRRWIRPALTPDDAIDRDLVLAGARRRAVRRGGAPGGRAGTRSTGSTSWATGSSRWSRASSRRWPTGSRAWPAGSRGSRRCSMAPARPLVGTDDGRPVGRFQTETAIEQLPGVAELIDDALARGRRGRRSGRGRRATAACGRPPRPRRQPSRPSRPTSATSSCRASEGEARLGADLFARKMRHTMRSEALTPERILAEAEREFVAVRAEMVAARARRRGRPGGPTRPCPDDEGALVRGVLDAIAADHPEADDLLDVLPRRERADRGVLPRARPHRPGRRAAWTSAGRRSSCARSAARCSSRRGHSRQGLPSVLRHHPDAGRLARGAARVVPARGQRPDAPPADHPRGGPRPLPPGRVRRTARRRCLAPSSRAACSPRAGRST